MQSPMTDYPAHDCDFCPGTVEAFYTHHEPLKVSGTLVLIEGFTIGKCNRCGHRYFPAEVLKRAEQVAQDTAKASHSETVPIVAA